MKLKKCASLVMAAAMVLGTLSGCGSTGGTAKSSEAGSADTTAENSQESKDSKEKQSGGNLVVYSACNDQILNTLIPLFEEETGIKVELLAGGTSEMLKRIQSESVNPYCDVMLGGTESMFYDFMDYFEDYTSVNDEFILDGHHCVQGKLTPINMDSAVIMWNKNLIGDIQVNSYKDFLNPELKGKIALPDPASSGNGVSTIADMAWIYNDHEWEGEAGWNFVTDFIKQLDGKVAASSGNAHKSVADGENTVTVTYEGAAFAYLKDGADVAISYPSEGVIPGQAVSAIIKDCKNQENAKIFIDFVTSAEVQDLFGTEFMSRPVREGAKVADFIPDADSITYIERDPNEIAEHKANVIDTFNEIFAEVQ